MAQPTGRIVASAGIARHMCSPGSISKSATPAPEATIRAPTIHSTPPAALSHGSFTHHPKNCQTSPSQPRLNQVPEIAIEVPKHSSCSEDFFLWLANEGDTVGAVVLIVSLQIVRM
jgi:hypothetical protein